jgi:LemA protein
MASGLALLGIAAGILIIGGILVYLVVIYNGLVRLKKNIEKSLGNIDVLLKQRNDEIPKLVDTAQEYMEYEEGVLQEITEARTAVQEAEGPDETADANEMLRGALGELFAVAEDYPELEATESFQQLQSRISSIEEQIADRRELYNEYVNTFNIRITHLPSNFSANPIGSGEHALSDVTEGQPASADLSSELDG